MVDNLRECDRDDVVCQIEVLNHLKALEKNLGQEAFLEKYPEALPLMERLPVEIEKQEGVAQASIDSCASPPEVAPELVEEPFPGSEEPSDVE